MITNYDRIARFYDVDMARNMPFDDVAFYRGLAAQARGRVLELGCGNGRILLELLAAGMDAVGIDASAGMLAELRRKARVRSLACPVAQMDMRALAFSRGFDLILCPYSLITYVTTDAALRSVLAGVRELLAPAGALVLDAFIPRPAVSRSSFTLDYRRPFGQQVLARWKRIVPLEGGRNRIERQYRVEDAAGNVLEAVDVAEEIRPFAPDALRQQLNVAGFAGGQEWWNYGATNDERSAQFFTLGGARHDCANCLE